MQWFLATPLIIVFLLYLITTSEMGQVTGHPPNIVRLYNKIVAEAEPHYNTLRPHHSRLVVYTKTGHRIILTQNPMQTTGGLLSNSPSAHTWQIKVRDRYGQPDDSLPIMPPGRSAAAGITEREIVDAIIHLDEQEENSLTQ